MSANDSIPQPGTLFIGRSTLDVLYALDALPREDTKVFARDMHAAPGGPALNAAITHALLGGRGTLVSAIGDGPWAGPVRAELERKNIAVIDLAAGSSYEMPLTTVLVNTANSTRTCVNPPRSDAALARIHAWDPSWGEIPRLILADGFHLEETLSLMTACRNLGAALCLDGGSWKAGTEDLASLLTVAICSERFIIPGRPANPDTTADWFAAKGVPYSAVTRGGRSILARDHDRRFEIEIEEVDVADTLGAGDVLHGAYCYKLRTDRQIRGISAQGIGDRNPKMSGIRNSELGDRQVRSNLLAVNEWPSSISENVCRRNVRRLSGLRRSARPR